MPTEINLTPTASNFEIPAHGQNIPARSWGIPSECRAAALLIHGLGAHSGWFEALGRRLKVKRVYALAYDQIGFGKRLASPFTSHQQWLQDVTAVYRYMQSQVGDKPIFLLGNSMGAMIALAQSEIIKPSGMVLFSPGFEGYPGTFTLGFRVKAILQALFSPDSEVCLPYNAKNVTRDENVRRWIDNDPERRLKVPARMLLELLKLTRQVGNCCPRVKVPVLMLTAEQEFVVDNRASAAAYAKFSSSIKRTREFKEASHDLMFDPVLDDVVEEVVQWMTECSPEKIANAGT